MQPNQAANELTEDQVLTFLVNTLNKEIDIELGENAEIDSEDIWDVLVGRRGDCRWRCGPGIGGIVTTGSGRVHRSRSHNGVRTDGISATGAGSDRSRRVLYFTADAGELFGATASRFS